MARGRLALVERAPHDLAAMVDAGPDQFGSDDVSTLLAGAARTVSLLTSGTCDGFLPRGG